MTAPTTFPAARSSLGSQLAPAAILTRARCLSFQIAEGFSSRRGNLAAGDPSPPRITRYPFSSSKHQPTHNIRGCSSERNEIPVRVSGRGRLVGRALHRPSFDLLLQPLAAIRDWQKEFRECPTSCRSTSVLKMRKNP